MRKSLRTLIIAVAALIMMLCLSSVAFADSTELTITNNTNMFKAVTASLETDGASETLVVALSGSGYHELFKGTYGEALRNGANEDNWIHGAVNKDEKWEFRIPLEKDESYVPVVAISNSYYEKYKQGQNPIERAFYPRQMEIDRTAKTLVTGDYDAVIELEIDNDIKMFKPGAKADLHVIGGPNSNDHKLLLTLYTDSTSITKFKSGETEIEKEPEENPFGGYTFKDIPVEVQKGAILGSWSAKNSKYYDRPYYINMQERKLYFRDAATTVEEFYGLSESEARVLAAVSATPKLCGQLIDAIYVQKRTDDTDALCAAAKACWDNLSDEDKEKVEGEDADPDYFGRDTGDASKDDPLNQDEIGDNELLVVSFGTSFNESRAEDIGGIEKALAKANPGWDVRRAFTAQIIINHVQARDGERIDNMKQALDRAVANEVKNLVVQPTHLMHGAEYDELVEELGKYENKFESVKIAEPLLGPVGETEEEINEDKKAVAEAAVAAAVEKAGYDSAAAMAEDKVALVFMGHGTSHEAKKTYPQMQAQMKELGFDNVFIGTVEGKPESTALPAVKKAIENAGYTKVILRPLMVVAGDHANNDMADPEDEGSWYHAFVNGGMYEVEGSDEPVDIGPGFGEENVTCQIEGLGRITAVQLVYMIHTDAAIASRVADLIDAIYVQKWTVNTEAQCKAAKDAWDALTDTQKELVEGEEASPDYFGRDTGDAKKDDPLNQDNIGEKELLVVSFGTSFNDSRAEDIGGIEKALAKANPGWAVRRAFTAQIIINHILARDGEKIDNVKQALDRAVANGVKELVVQPTHLMHGAEYDELVEELEEYENKFESVKVAEPLLGPVGATDDEINEDKQAVAAAAVAEAVKVSGYESIDAMAQAKTALVFMGHGTSHEAKKTYTQMQAQMKELGFNNVFIGTVEGKPESTALPAVKKAVEDAGYTRVILRPLMVVAGDHANNDMADLEDEGSWAHGFVYGGEFEVEGADEPVDIGEGFGEDNVKCQIEGLGRIAAVQDVYAVHTDAAIASRVADLIDAIYVQKWTVNTEAQCKAAKDAWDALTDAQKELVEGEEASPDYFGRDTGDAKKDDPLNQDNIGEKELLVVSFGTSFNDSRAEDIGGIEKALAKANPDWAVRRAFTAQIIINHVLARDGEKIDNVKQALDRAVANGVKELVVQPTHLMHGAEYDELVEELATYQTKIEKISVAEPLLGPVGATEEEINEDKKAVAEAAVAEAVKVSGYESIDAMAQAKTALVFMGHGTSHEAKKTYTQMQAQMKELGFNNVFIGTVEGKPESTALPAVKKAVEDAGYTRVILRPLMVVAGDHANNDMADLEDEGSWAHGFVYGGEFEVEGADKPVDIGEGFGEDNVKCQIEGLGRIAAVQDLYVAHSAEFTADAEKKEAEEEAAKAVEEAEAIDKTKYTEANAAAVQKAIDDLKMILADPMSTTAQIKAAQNALAQAIKKAEDEKIEPIGKLKNNTIKASGKTVKVKASKKKTTFKKAKAFSVKKAVGKVTFKKKSGNKKVTVSKAGKVTVKKGLKKGKTYKIKVKVTAAGNHMYKSKTVTVTLKVKVTK